MLRDRWFWMGIISLVIIIIGIMSRYYYVINETPYKTPEKIYYFDNNSTTLIYDKDVLQRMNYWISCGNPSNILHDFGRRAREEIETCRHQIAQLLIVKPAEIFYTSCATESNNIVIQGVISHHLDKNPKKTIRIITTSFEHPSVLKVCEHYKDNPHVQITFIKPRGDKSDPYYGCVHPQDVEKAILASDEPVALITIMYGNNETGAVQDIGEIGRIARKYKIFFHTDATQTMGKMIMHPEELGVDSLSFSGHKFHGPKGIGGLYISSNKEEMIKNLCYGGEQEHERRPGTENVANIVGISYAFMKTREDRKAKNEKLKEKSDWILSSLKERLDIELIGPPEKRLPHTLLLMFKDLKTCNKMLVHKLNESQIYVSVGSACQTTHAVSHVLNVMGVSDADKLKIIRISLSDYTTMDECKYLVKKLIKFLEP
jgi:cysteine desulfurase